MRHWGFIRLAGTSCLTVVLLAGCSAAGQRFNSAASFNAAQGETGSWMQANASKSTLIYAGGFYGGVYVYDYSTGKRVGKLSADSDGMCVDAKGDVYVTELSGSTLEYAHGGTKVLKTFNSDGIPAGCSVDAKNDLAVTSARPADVTVFAGGDPNKSTTYSDSSCTSLNRMGYDNKGNLMGQGGNSGSSSVIICALLAGSQKETTLSMEGFSIGAQAGTMWDGKYVALSDQNVDGKVISGIAQASLSGITLVSHGETLLSDKCSGGHSDITGPFIVGAKNTPINDRQGKVVVATDSVCQAKGSYLIEFWHYPKGGNPFKSYKETIPIGGVAVSIGS
jgi:hypothetical protein